MPPTTSEALDLAYSNLQSSPGTPAKDQFYRELYKFAKRNLPQVPKSLGVEVEDIIQECIIHTWDKLPEFQNRAKFSTWAFNVVRRKAIDCIRVETARLNPQEPLEALEDVAVDNELDLNLALEASLKTLPKEEREVVDLKRAGHTNEEIGRFLNIHHTAVSKRWLAALERLKG